MKEIFLLVLILLISCDTAQNIGIIKTPKLQTTNQTNVSSIQIVSVQENDVGPNPIIIEKNYLDNQLKALQLQYITDKISLPEYLEVKEDAMADKTNPNFIENIEINPEDINTSLKSVQLDYINGKITLNEYLEEEKKIVKK